MQKKPHISSMGTFILRESVKTDLEQIRPIFRSILEEGATYAAQSEQTTDREIDDYWWGETIHTYVATLNEKVVGAFKIVRCYPGHGSHIANASHIVHKEYHGMGIGRLMGESSLIKAKELGFEEMQYLYVVEANTAAVNLWKSLGFTIQGTLKTGFKTKTGDYLPTLFMHRYLV